MTRRFLPFAVAAVLLLSGCVALDFDTADVDEQLGTLTASSTPLWHNPQDFPHPAFNYPTLTNPPEGEDVPEWWKPIDPAAIPDEIAGIEYHGGTGDAVPSGAGIAIFGSLVVAPAYNDATHIIDISNPQEPQILSSFETQTRGAAIIPYPDGRLVTVLSTSANILVYDITDPTAPQELPSLEPPTGSHKVGVVPGTPLVYNANSAGGGLGYAEDGTGQTEIYDLSDPENPELVQEFQNGYGCHHIYFYNDVANDRYRATCAGLEYTQIWDIADPYNPEIITSIAMPHGQDEIPGVPVSPAMLSHFAIFNKDMSVLIVGDETGGGAAPGCDAYVDTPAGTMSGPLGNLYFYDVTDEENPRLVSWISPTHHYPTNPPVNDDGVAQQGGFGAAGCTAHHGRLVPDPAGERDLLAMAFYGAGVVLVDFTDLENPRIVDQWNENTNTWEVWYYNGYLVTGDMSRGLDVLTLR